MNLSVTVSIISLISYMALIVFVLRHGWRRKVNRVFILYLAAMTYWQLNALMVSVSTDAQMAGFWYQMMLTGGVFAVLYFHFTQVFLNIRATLQKALLVLGYAIGLVMAVCSLAVPRYAFPSVYVDRTGLYVPEFGPLMYLYALYVYVYLGLGVFNPIRQYTQTQSDLTRNRLRYLILGIGVVFLGTFGNFSPALKGYPLEIVGNLINAFLITYAILRYQLLDITLVIRRGLLYSIPTAIIGAAYFLVIFLATRLFRALAGPHIFLLALIVAIIAAVAAQPLRDLAQQWIDRLFFREKYDSSLMLQRLSGAAASILDLDRLTGMILDEITETMHVTRAAFFLRRAETGEVGVTAQRGLDQNTAMTMRLDHPVVDWLSSHDNVLTRHDVDVMPQFRALWAAERHNLERMGAELFVPLKAKDELVGALAVGPKLSNATYSQDDQRILTTLANQMAVAIENARLYSELGTTLQALQNAHGELEERVRERTAELAQANQSLQSEVTERERAEEEIRQRNQELAALNYELSLLLEASNAVSSSLELDEVLHIMARQLTELAQVTCCRIALLDETEENLIVRSAYPTDDGLDWQPRIGQRYPLDMVPWQRQVLESGEPLLWRKDDASIQADVEVTASLDGEVQVAALLPVILRGKVTGVASLGERRGFERSPLNRDKIDLCQAIINEMVMAIDNARLYEEMVQRAKRIAVLHETTKVVSSSLDLLDVFGPFTAQVSRLVDFDYASVALLDESEDAFDIVSLTAGGEAESGQKIRLPLRGTASDWTARHRRPFVGKDWVQDHQLLESEILLTDGMRSAISVPLISKGMVLGTFNLGSREPGRYTERDCEVLQPIAEQLAVAAENAQLYARIRSAERHLASVVESANDLVVSMDSGGRITTWNRTAERISGFTAEAVAGNELATLCDDAREADMRAMLAQVARGKQVKDTEIDLLTEAGQHIPVAWSCSLMQNDGGQPAGIVAVGRDLTERRKLEAQLIQSAKMVSLGVMAGGIAHEIRNPLAVSSAAAQLLLENPDDETLRTECAEKMYAGVERASRIIESLLQFARPSEGHRVPLNVNKVLSDTLSFMNHQLTRQNIALVTHFSPHVPPVMGDKNLLQQVFSNLVLNACNAMPSSGRLTIATQLSDGDQVHISFSDTGYGIPEQHLGRVFDPFFTTMPAGKGTGLGLSICYAIIEQHQGEVDVHSKVGVGSTFVIKLPAARVENSDI